MITRKILSKPVGRILAVLLALACCLILAGAAKDTINVCTGRIEIELFYEKPFHKYILLDGEYGVEHDYYIPEDTIVLIAPHENEIASPARTGILAVYFVRVIPVAACLAMILVVLINIAAKRTFARQNAALLLICGVIMLLAIPAQVFVDETVSNIVETMSDNRLSVSYNVLSSPHAVYGLVLALAAYIFKTGANAERESAPKQPESN